MLADSQAVIYTIAEAHKGLYEVEHFIATRVCAYGHKGSVKIGETRVPEPTEGWGADVYHVTLDGAMVAYEKRGSLWAAPIARIGARPCSAQKAGAPHIANGSLAQR